MLIDERPPVSYTSSRSTECYRNYWAGHLPMTAFMDRSIDLLEARAAESSNGFSMNRRSYTFLTSTEHGAAQHLEAATTSRKLGLGTGTVHPHGDHGVAYRGAQLEYNAVVDGLSVFQGHEAIGAFFGNGGLPPFVSPDVTSLLHCGRCGWLNAQQMGMQLLEQARELGARTLTPATLTSIRSTGSRVNGVDVRTADGDALRIDCGAFVNCAGPYASNVNKLIHGTARGGCDAAGVLPLANEIHAKAVLRDVLEAVPMDAPMMIFEDEVQLEWSDEERDILLEMGGFDASLARPLPGGAHLRPYPGATGSVLLLWEALHMDMGVSEPPPAEPELRGQLFVELLLRGLKGMVPRLGDYFCPNGTIKANFAIDGGYYTKTPDNLPVIGALPDGPEGSFICAGFSGYGVMAANAAGELLACHVAGDELPASYVDDFRPERWMDRAYVERVAAGMAGKGLQI